MSLPALEKTWQFSGSTVVPASSSLVEHQTVLLGIVNALLAMPLMPWTCRGSSDGTTAGMDAVNRWSAIAKLVFKQTSGTHGWIVLRQAGIAAKCEWLIDLLNTNTGNATSGMRLAMYMSPAAGFGTVNGGTDGSTSARPTATDEVSIMPESAPKNFLEGGTGTTTVSRRYAFYVMQSTDGECTRAFVRCPDGVVTNPDGFISAFFLFDKPRDPAAGWTAPAVAGWMNGPSAAPTPLATRASDIALCAGRGPAGAMTLHLVAPDALQNPIVEAMPINSLSGEQELYGVRIASFTVGSYGTHGALFDLYWCSYKLQDGDTFPADGSRQFIAFYPHAHPWGGALPVVT